jgi:hypothetical protein
VLILAWLGWVGCSSAPPPCGPGEERLGAELSCDDGYEVISAIEFLGGRPLAVADRNEVLAALASEEASEPGRLAPRIREIHSKELEIRAMAGLQGAEARSAWAYEASVGEGLLSINEAGLGTVLKRSMSIQATASEDKLVLTESDVEGWLRYASLAREVQGGTPLRLSVADRVALYERLRTEFKSGDRAEKIALVGIGPYWGSINAAWDLSSYAEQQAWAENAPLPPAMTAKSLGYAQAVFEGDLGAHARHLHEVLGPLSFREEARR